MTLETFFEKFDLFADAPDAVAKMRELVLELAVRGRLLSSSSPDSSAPSDPSSPFAIPQDWQWIALNKAADCRAAAKVDSASLNDSDWVLDLEDIDGGAGKVIATATFAERRSLSTKASFQKGDVLYGKLRPYLNKVVIADRPGFCTTEIIPLRPQKFVAAGYLRLFLRSPHFLRYAAAKNYGMKMPRLGTQDLESSAIPLPPLAEQKRIVAKVDELMALCDRLEAQQQERETRHAALARASLARFADAPTPANLNFLFHSSFNIHPSSLRQSILTLAVQGKLISQDHNDEPAAQQLETIQVRKAELVRKQVIKKSDPSRLVDPDEVDHDIPDSWAWVRLVEICELITDGTHLTPKYTESGRMFLSAQNVKPFKFMPTKHRFVSEEHYQGYVKNRKPERGDVLLTRVGAGIGEAATIDQDLDFAIYVSLGLVRPVRGFVFSDYITLWLNSPDGTEKSSRNTYGKGVSQGNLNLSLIRNFLVPLPPLAEQRRIVAKVEQLMALVDELETQLAAFRATAANLLSALVAELTGTANDRKVSPSPTSGTGRRGRPRKSL